jgi:hypothetical protein
MPRFAQTENALADIAANFPSSRGRHFGDGIKAGARGVSIGEVAYDPSKHSPTKINPLSINGLITGEPFVPQVIPSRPIEANIIVHNDPRSNRKDLYRTKFSLAESLAAQISGSMPAFRDRVNVYLLGEEVELSRELGRLDAEKIDNTEDPVIAAQTTAELCMNGLAFVISDFENLPLYETGSRFRGTVGIKNNHQLDLDISSIAGNRAVLSLGQAREVKLWKPKEVSSFNEALARHDQEVVGRLERVGMKIARVISSQSEYNGYNLKAADQSIASAINRLDV